ncbi:MAG: RDD family protein, partial [Verrucomicrobia bacterium]|nr:RDD family protein [Verrucomicrobiota bacterium]
MQIYITSKGEKQGPFTIYRVKEMIDADELTPDDLAWHEGLDGWRPIKKIPVIASTLKSLEKKRPQSEVPPPLDQGNERDTRTSLPLPSSVPGNTPPSLSQGTRNVHPFLRFWARFFDYMLLMIMVWSVFDYPKVPPIPSDIDNVLDLLKRLDEMIPREEQIRVAITQCGALFAWIFIEALLLSSFGTTPGKWLFNIRVTRKNGSLFSYSEAIGRSTLVWFIGVGLGISLLQFMTMAFSL